MLRNSIRSLFAILAVAAVFAMVTADADARPRSSFGSRGTRTFSAPPPTATAPRTGSPIERTMTRPAQPGAATAARPAAAPSPAGGLLSRPGILGGLAAGFLGAGLFGLLSGHGLAGGLGSIASFLGLLLQLGIVAVVAMLIWRWWQGRSQPAAAYAGGMRMHERAPDDGRSNMSLLGGLGGALGGSQAAAGAPVDVKPEDFDAFERLLGEIQTAYGKEDLNTLRTRVTPEMLSYYSEEMAHNTSNGDINQISDVKLLQGDLAESWSEGNDEYATVAMRYSLNDRIVDRNDGKLIEQLPSEATELWTFRRARGGNWILSAIQQTDEADKAA
jgi:predicted lipid-binding transport protein (Tim44 family)